MSKNNSKQKAIRRRDEKENIKILNF